MMYLPWLLIGLALALWPYPAQANSGSALLWAGGLPLLLGNLGIGYLEAGILSRVFHTPRWRSFGVMVLANLASTLVGLRLLPGWLSHHPAVTLATAGGWIWGAVGLALVMTLVMEYPFVWALLRQRPRSATTALKANVLIHSVSYLVLVGWYALSSQATLLTQVTVVPVVQLQPSADYVLYFKSLADQPMQMNLDGSGTAQIAPEVFAALDPQRTDRFGPVELNPLGEPPDTTTSAWRYEINIPRPGLVAQHLTTRQRLELALETPVLSWPIRYATHLAGDLAVFQLGDHQIVVFQPQTRQVAILAQGHNPVVQLRPAQGSAE